jgi:hypothetical protein
MHHVSQAWAPAYKDQSSASISTKHHPVLGIAFLISLSSSLIAIAAIQWHESETEGSSGTLMSQAISTRGV